MILYCKNLLVYRSALRNLLAREKKEHNRILIREQNTMVMERQLCNKVVVVTGGAKGLGYAIADSYLQCGARTTILLDIDEQLGIQAAETLTTKYGYGRASFIKCDVVKDLEVVSCEILRKTVVDVLVNNAGLVDEASARRTLEVNTIAVVEWGMRFWEYMRIDKGGRGGTILNIASIYGFRRDPWLVYYKTSKHAVIGFNKTLGHAYNYCRTGVRVIALCPGFTNTALTNALGTKEEVPAVSTPFDFQKNDFDNFIKCKKFQNMDAVGQAAVEMFFMAETGSAWVAEEDKPIELAPIN